MKSDECDVMAVPIILKIDTTNIKNTMSSEKSRMYLHSTKRNNY